MKPNTLVRFDPKTEKFQTWAIPSGGGVVRNMMVTRDGNIAMAKRREPRRAGDDQPINCKLLIADCSSAEPKLAMTICDEIEEAFVLNRAFYSGNGYRHRCRLVIFDDQPSQRVATSTDDQAANPAAATQPPFSGAVMAGDTLYLSGMLGTGDTAEAAATTGLTAIQITLRAPACRWTTSSRFRS